MPVLSCLSSIDAPAGIGLEKHPGSIDDPMRVRPPLLAKASSPPPREWIDSKAADLLDSSANSAAAQRDRHPSAALRICTRRRGSSHVVRRTCRLQHWSNEQDAAVQWVDLLFQLLSR